MANKTFVSNSTLTIADNNAEAFGSSVAGTEIIKIRAGVTGVKLDANFERIDLSGTLASYKFVVVSGTGLQIQNVSDSAVVATIPNINQSVKIAFTDGSATLAQTGATVFTLNSAALVVGATGAAAPVSLTGANVLSTAAADISTAPDASTIFVLTSNIAYEGTAAADTLDLRTTTSPTQTLSVGAAGAGAPNTILVKDGVDISGANVLYFTNLSFDATSLSGTNDLTMTAAQHAAFTGTILASGTGTTSGEKIILTTAATGLSLLPAVDNYTLANFVNSVTQTAVGQAITGAAGVDTITAITGVTSTSDLLAGANVVIVPNGANISAGTFSSSNSGSITYNLDNAATSTLNVTQAAGTLSATGTQNVTLTTAASGLALNAAIETFVLADAANTVTLGTAAGNLAQTVTGGTSTDVLTLGAGTYTGKWTGISGLSLVAGNTSIAAVTDGTTAGAVIAGSPTLLITPTAGTLNNVTMTAAQYAGLGAITATGTTTTADTITLTGAGNVTVNAAIETYDLGANGRTIDLGSSSVATAVIGGVGVDQIKFGTSGNNGTDTITSFTTTSDKLDFNAAIAGTTGTITEISAVAAAVTTTGLLDFVRIITTNGTLASVTTSGTATLATADLTAGTLTNVAAFIAEKWSGVSSATGTDTGVFVINSSITGNTSGKAYVYQWDNNTTADVFGASELSLIGVISRTVASGDIVALA